MPAMGVNRGTGGDTPPSQIFKGGHNIKCPLPTVLRLYDYSLKLWTFFFFFFFLLVREVWCRMGTPTLCLENWPKNVEVGEEKKLVGGFPPSHGREISENYCMKTVFYCTLRAIIRPRGVGYVKWIYQSPIPPPPFFFFFLLQSVGNQWGRGMGPSALVSLSYASESGATRNCQWRAKAREQSDRAG